MLYNVDNIVTPKRHLPLNNNKELKDLKYCKTNTKNLKVLKNT